VTLASATGWLRVQAALSTMALVVVLVRSAQIARVSNDTGAIALWRPILTTQAAYWISWSLWAGALVPVIRRLVERRPSRPAGVGVLIGLALAPSMLLPMVYAPVHWWAFGEQWPLHSAYHHMVTHDVLTNFLLGGTIVGVVYGFLSLQRTRRLEVQAAQLGEQLTRAQLETLRAQLDPHFLFNSLNSVAVLARRGKVAEVEQMVTGLADLLRHSLESSRSQLVSLRVEIDALRRYVEIEQVRFRERLAVTIDVPDALLDRPVPSFLLQPLVENGIRHGLTDPHRPLCIGVLARVSGATLVLTVSDDGAGLTTEATSPNGVGLGNTRARLRGLYGDGASLTLGRGLDGRGTVVTVTIPLAAGGAEAGQRP
jgi:signal transduction histidine kinase